MITPNQLNDFLAAAKTAIDEINYTEIIVDDSQLTNNLRAIKTTDNHLVFAVLPDHTLMGGLDTFKFKNSLMFLVLEKTDNKSFANNVEYMQVFERTLETTKKLLAYIIDTATGQADNSCSSVFRDINIDSISIQPAWELAQTNGYMIEIETYTR